LQWGDDLLASNSQRGTEQEEPNDVRNDGIEDIFILAELFPLLIDDGQNNWVVCEFIPLFVEDYLSEPSH
jgi:hypothetical protein